MTARPGDEPFDFTRRELLGGMLKGSAIAGAIGFVGADALGFGGGAVAAHASQLGQDTRPKPWNKVGKPVTNNQQSWKPSTRNGNATVEEGGYPMNIPGYDYHSFGAAGCGMFAAYAMAIKSGKLGSKVGIDSWVNELISKGAVGSVNYYNGYGIAQALGVETQQRVGPLTIQRVKQGYDEGFIPVVYLNVSDAGIGVQHFVMVDHIVGDKLYIIDSEGMCETLNEYTAKVSIAQIDLYKGIKPAKDLPKLTEGKGGAADPKIEDKQIIAAGGIVREEDLKGMAHYKQTKQAYDSMIKVVNPLSESSLAEMSIAEQKQVTELDKAINGGKTTFQDNLSVGVSFVGLLGMVYSLFLFAAYFFDKTNNFVNVNALSKLTAGKMETVHDVDDVRTEDGVRYVGLVGVLKWAAVCIIVSLLLMSGVLFDFLIWFQTFIKERF